MEDLSKAIQGLAAAVASVVIAASVAYETGYFSIIGQKYQGVLSASDYLSSALEWLPWLGLLYGLGLLLARIGWFQFSKRSPDERSDIRDCSVGQQWLSPAYRSAHAGYSLRISRQG